MWEDMANKGSSFADFVRLHPHTYACTQQFLLPLWVAVMINNTWSNFKLKMKEKKTSNGNLILHFLLLYFTTALVL